MPQPPHDRLTPTPGGLPLPTLLSQPLVAFTIEFDNEAEHRLPHWTTNAGRAAGASDGLWLVSMAMWLNCMLHAGADWMPVREVVRRARTQTNFAGMQRWRYIDLVNAPDETRAGPPVTDLLVRSTRRGRRAQEIWRPLDGVVEARWEQRFGRTPVDALRAALVSLVSGLDARLPDCMPILGHGLLTKGPARSEAIPAGTAAADLSLPALLARPLIAFAMEFESEFEPRASLAIGADVLRVLDEPGVRVQDLPRLSGVSREALSIALGVLAKRGLTVTEANPAASRGKVVRLTAAGLRARDGVAARLRVVEARWRERHGERTIDAVRTALEPLAGDADQGPSPLFAGLEPYPDGWRAAVRRPDVLPHFPMVLHRGGYPDGS
jgi:DNA-binding MarR family transcriptional regulator